MKPSKLFFLLLGVSGGSFFFQDTAFAADRQFPFNYDRDSFNRDAERRFPGAPQPFPFYGGDLEEQRRRVRAHMLEGVSSSYIGGYAHFNYVSSTEFSTQFKTSVVDGSFCEPPTKASSVFPFDLHHVPKPTDLQSIEEALKLRGIKDPETVIATYIAALASQKPQQDFFGFDLRDQPSQKSFQDVLSSLDGKGYGDSPILNDWIHQPNAAIKLAGFLNSFGNTLALADSETVGDTLTPDKSVNPTGLLDKAYTDMARLISGQVVGIDEHRKATKEEERILIQAATNLGHKKAIELDILRRDGLFEESVVQALLSDYNLGDPLTLNRTTLRHNAILLSLSLSSALGRDLSRRDYEIESLLRRHGFDSGLLQEVDAYRDYAYQSFSFLRPSRPLGDIISGRFLVYAPSPPKPKESPVKEQAAQTLKGIETLGLDQSFVYEKLLPYGKPAFDALKNPRKFIEDIRRESRAYRLSEVQRNYFGTMLDEIERALLNPSKIHEIHGFGYGSVFKKDHGIPLTEQEERDHQTLTKRTWLGSCYDFIGAYLFAKDSDSLAEFYADATPPENAPCLPGKIRAAQEWFESKTMKVDDTASVLEKVFAGMAGIELSSAVQQLYRKYVWANLEIYRAEQGGIDAEEARKHADFKREYLTIRTIKEGLVDIVKDNLPSVIRKYRLNRSIHFPIAAFHSYKYGDVRLQDGLGDDDYGITNQQEILRRQAQANEPLLRAVNHVADRLIEQGAIEVYRPSGLMSFGDGGF